MKKKELNMVKLISCIIKNKHLRMTENDRDKPSIYSMFYKNSNGIYNSGNAPFDERTLRRYVEELCKENILQKDDNEYYFVNPDYFKLNFSKNASEFQKLADIILDNGGINTYVMLRELLYYNRNNFMDDMKLKRYSDSIKEPVYMLKNNRTVIRHINEAIDKHCRIRVEYKGKEHTIMPVCYVISRDGIRTYLYYKHKNQIGTPMELQYVHFLGEDGPAGKDSDKDELMEQARNTWDIEIGKKVNVKLLVCRDDEGKESYKYVIEVLKNYFGEPVAEDDSYFIYSGEVHGINDFKAWLRKYIDICIVIEPVSLKNEIIESLKNKIRRYEEDADAGQNITK